MSVLDENLNTAFMLCEKDFSHSDLIEFLKQGTTSERQMAALRLDCVKTEVEAEIFLSNLIGVDGKIREAIAHRLNFFLKTDDESAKMFSGFAKVFVAATIDVDGNVCRQIIDGLYYLKANDKFRAEFVRDLMTLFDEIFLEYDKLSFKARKYTINKIMFKFYWALEGMNVVLEDVNGDKLCEILSKCACMEDYTVREKVAKILTQARVGFSADLGLLKLRENLKLDKNYFVRRYFEN